MALHLVDSQVTLHHGDALDVLRTLPDESVDCCVTSPPYYGLRDYGVPGQYGLEPTPAEYVARMVAVFAQVRRALAADGTLWLNIGDSYANDEKWGGASGGKHVKGLHGQTGIGRAKRATGLPAKSLMGIPWRLALALQDDGWTLRSDIIWRKPNAMPESVTDRPSCTHEHVFLLAKGSRYHFDLDAIREPLARPEALGEGIVFAGRNGGKGKLGSSARRGGLHPSVYGGGDVPPGKDRPKSGGKGPHHDERNPKGRNPSDVWAIPTSPFPDAHFAVMAPDLARRCVAAGCKPGGTVLDPFCGVGTTGMVAARLGHRFVGIDLSASTLDLALRTRLAQGALIEEPTP